ncbi:hypothetical protein Tco_1208908, partial [Tanacetum coccineum]
MEESCWIEVMQEEIHEFERLEVWELVPRPDKAMIISLKWIYKMKLDEYGGVLNNKAWICYKQEYGSISDGCEDGISKWDFKGRGVRVQISQSHKSIFINQSKYALEMLKKYGLDQCDAVDIPMVGQSKLDKDLNETPIVPTRYRGMVGSLMYLTASCPDLMSTMEVVKIQDVVHREIRSQLTDYGFYFNKIPLYSDSKSAIALSCNSVQHSRTKHIDVRYHFIKEQVENE